MDIFDILLHTGLITGALVTYLLFFKKSHTRKGDYRIPGWNYPLKLLWARYYAVRQWKAQLPQSSTPELPRKDLLDGWDAVTVRAASPQGSALLLEIRKQCGRKPLAEVTVHVTLTDGTTFVLPRVPDTAVGAWEDSPEAWSAGGLKIQVLEDYYRLRILYNGMLTNVNTGTTQHAKLNLIWTAATEVMQHPKDWSDQLAAEALALEPWRDASWADMLGKWEDGSWLQFGAAQGRFEAFDARGAATHSEYMRARGTHERRWAPHGWAGLRRSLTLTTSVADGTAIQLRVLSYKNVLTQCVSGTVRLPCMEVRNVMSTNLSIADFPETPEGVPELYSFHVSTAEREMRVVVRCNPYPGRVLSGVPSQQETLYRTLHVDIDGEPGGGIIELGYVPEVISEPSAPLSPPRELFWVSEREVGAVGYCVQFENRAAACPDYVGGKGASLALLASVQHAQGYRVPPGFCLTVRALEKHLDANPALMKAIREIEAVNEDYKEAVFKEKCNRAVELFVTTEIVAEVREEILTHLNELRKKTTKENLGPERRFAVRSSAVGEDSDTLSAAGQNETILGCVSDADVLRGVQKCWGSMFAFTSAYYRRQNGQPCVCGGGVVVQALVAARAAGVMFTRHPDAGDPSRLLLTANYGLGETVVSGAVEPDTIVVSRSLDGHLEIASKELGTKTRRMKAGGIGEVGVSEEEVPEAERAVACLSDGEAMRLARIGVAQEALWGAGRDIEWAISQDDLFLVQARPITSLGRWTEEELLHELDSPIMADDEFTTFANTGEVLPKAITPLTHDLMLKKLVKGMNTTVTGSSSDYQDTLFITHNRAILPLYNTVYRMARPKVDVNIRMMEMAVHGHKVADEEIMRRAMIRRPPHAFDKIKMGSFAAKTVWQSKFYMNNAKKEVEAMNIKLDSEDPMEILKSLEETEDIVMHIARCHSGTSAASTCTQFIAMAILLEGSEDFTPEQCNEICTLLGSGDVLSAEVPQGLARLAQQINESGKAEAFRAQDPQEAMTWLEKNLPKVFIDLSNFLEIHGHRAIMEFDMYTKPWVLVPEELMKILQNMKVSKPEKKVAKSTSDIIKSLTTPQRSSTKRLLAWVIPWCRSMVQRREGTKAALVKGVHRLRLGARRLGRLLRRTWYLPDPELVFFFRGHELATYIRTRDPALLRKATQRMQYYPAWCKLKFSELNKGWVLPLEARAPQVLVGDVRLEGTSVCGGDVVARACVVKDLSEIHQLEQGDVLITNATDIGWSPYFPLLSGIVTELGGLISHGAVIAREYGLPCIVGATHATEIFKTGDIVRLRGSKGIIEKVEVTEEAANVDN